MHVDGRPAAIANATHGGRSWPRRLAPVVVVALAMVLVFAMGWHRHLSLETLVHHRSAIDGFVDAHYPLAIAAFIGVYIAVAALSVPGAAFLTVTSGILFGWWVGALASVVGATIGATILFLIARTAFGEFVIRNVGPRAAKVVEGFCADAFNYLLFLRLVPVFPFWLVNLAAALAGVGLGTFVVATVLGIIPGSCAFALIGAGLDSVITAHEAVYKDCMAAGRVDCRLDFEISALVTPQLIAALIALGLVALIPVAVRKWRAHSAAGSAG